MIFNKVNEELGYLIKGIQQDIRKKMDKSLLDISLTTPQYALLSQLRESPGLSNAQLARKSFVTPQTMNLIVKNLTEREFLIRKASDTNGKILNTQITSKGFEILACADNLVFEIQEKIFGCLSPDEASSLKTILIKLKHENSVESN